jgi:CheY-like chemotaxis protein
VPARSPVRVLVVEDDPDQRYFISTLLKGSGYGVTTAEDGVRALRVLTAIEPNIVLLDLMMPMIDGYDVLQELREHYPSLPVLVVSGALDAKQRARDLGAVAVITKPIDANELLGTVRAIAALSIEDWQGRLPAVSADA